MGLGRCQLVLAGLQRAVIWEPGVKRRLFRLVARSTSREKPPLGRGEAGGPEASRKEAAAQVDGEGSRPAATGALLAGDGKPRLSCTGVMTARGSLPASGRRSRASTCTRKGAALCTSGDKRALAREEGALGRAQVPVSQVRGLPGSDRPLVVWPFLLQAPFGGRLRGKEPQDQPPPFSLLA